MKSPAFIFARGGSKGLPGKHLLEIDGIPLIGHAIMQAQQSESVSHIFVSTDCSGIAEVARNFGANIPFIRPRELATDITPEIEVWRHAILWYESVHGALPKPFVSIPATAPLRLPADIDLCVERYHFGDCDVVLTVSRSRRHPGFNMVVANKQGFIDLFSPPSESMNLFRRQDCSQVFDVETICYVADPTFVLNTTSLFFGKTGFVEIPKQRAIDIDDRYDFELAKLMFGKILSE